MGRENPNYKTLKRFKQDIVLYKELLETYIDLNSNVMFELFYGSTLSDYADMDTDIPKYNPKSKSSRGVIKYPLFLSQMAMLYRLDTAKYKGQLNDALFEFFAFNFRNNTIFIVNNEGFLIYILVAQVTKQQIVAINTFYSQHIDDLDSFQYVSREYNPDIEPFKPLGAKVILGVKQEDVVITYF